MSALLSRRDEAGFAAAALVALVLAVSTFPAMGQVPAPVPVASAALPASAPTKPRGGAAKTAEVPPTWTELTPPQKQALAPLAGTWRDLGDAHKRKWLALSQNFPKLPAAEQVTLHSRMTEWAALSPKQRTLARLNFGETKRISPDDKKARWEAYQALPDEQKRRLAADAAVKPPTTAAAIKPVPRQKLATVPRAGQQTRAPRIAAGLPPESGHLPAAPERPAPLAPAKP